MANVKISALTALNTVDTTTQFAIISNTTGTNTTYRTSIANVTTAVLSNGNSNIRIGTNSNIGFSAIGNSNVFIVTGTGANITGTMNVTGNITGGNLTISGISNLSSNANVKITGGTSGQALTTDGTGNLSWTTQGSGNVGTAYGQFWSNLTQNVALPNTEYRFAFNNSDLTSNVTLGTGASNSRIIINQTGIYNIEFSAQIDKAPVGSSTSSAYIWLKKNGTAIPDSAGFSTLDNAMQDVLGWNILVNVANVGDYYEIAYAATHTYVSFPTIAGNATVGYPASPSIIVTVTPIGA